MVTKKVQIILKYSNYLQAEENFRKFAVDIDLNINTDQTGLTGFDSIALCKCKHVVRCVISTLI